MRISDLWRLTKETYQCRRPWWHPSRFVPGWRTVLLLALFGIISCFLANCFVVRLTYLEAMRRKLQRLEEAAR